MTIKAEIIADSISAEGIRLTTMQLQYPRFIHAEFMTHRVFSRNASSSRAIPVHRMIQNVLDDPAAPIHWGVNQKGMQAEHELVAIERAEAVALWHRAGLDAVKAARILMILGVHKQIVNRFLEPWNHIDVVVTATDWDNFYKLRRHPDAQPEIKALADAMWAAHQASDPQTFYPGQWHLPYVDLGTWKTLRHTYGTREEIMEVGRKVSMARCARVSYTPPGETETSIEKDLELYQRLVESEPVHASPAEHQATPDKLLSSSLGHQWVNAPAHGNFCGWIQHRKLIEGIKLTELK